MVIAFILFFFALSSGSFFGSALFNWRFEETVQITACSIVLLLFLFGLFGWLLQGLFFVCFIIIASIVYAVIYILKNRKINDFVSVFFTPGFFVFLLVYIALVFLHFGRQPYQWDEFSHWASVVKCMVNIDSFITNPDTSQMMFRSYVPGMALFQYFLQKIIIFADPSVSFCEWALYFSYHIFAVSFFLPFLKKSHFQVFFSAAIVFFFIFLSPEIAFSEYYLSSIYIDPFVGLIAGAGAAYLFMNNNTDRITCLYILCTIAILVLSKDVGLMFAFFLAVIFLFQIFLFKEEGRNHRHNRPFLLSGCTIAAVVIPKVIWNIHLKAWHVTRSFSSPIKLGVLWNVLNGTDQTYRTTVLNNYKDFYFHAKPIISWFDIEFTYPMLLIILAVILIAIYIISYSACSGKERISGGIVIGVTLFQACFYAFGMLVVYLFRFPKSQALELASAYRYLEIPVLALQTMIVLILLEKLPAGLSWRRAAAIGLVIAFLLPAFPGENIKDFLTRASVHKSVEYRRGLDSYTERIVEKLQSPPSTIYIIAQKSDGYIYWALRYNLKPNTVNEKAWSISPDGSPLYEGDSYTKKKSPEDWKKELNGYDYVILYEITEAFKDNYSDLFDQRYFIYPGLYKVNHVTQLLEPVR